MKVIDLKFPLATVDDLFPCDGDEGQDVRPTAEATARAAAELGVNVQDIEWFAPDVFSVRYGSSFVATAHAGGKGKVRFHSDEGDFREGDDDEM